MQNPPHQRNINLLSAALCIIVGGLPSCVSSVKTGWPLFAILAGCMVGMGVGLAYLGARWDKKTTANTMWGLLAAVVVAGGVTATLMAVQGTLIP